MSERNTQPKRRSAKAKNPSFPSTPRELIILAKPQVGLRATPTALASVFGTDVSSLSLLLKEAGAVITPVFGPEERIQRRYTLTKASALASVPELSTYYHIEADDEKLDDLAEKLLNEAVVDCAYIKPPMSPPAIFDLAAPISSEAPPVTLDFTPRQFYLDPATGGIDARYAWTRPGGKGQGVQVIDIEGAWRFTHEDLLQNQGGVIGGTQSANIGWRDHGTAVVGVFSGDENSFGVTGIAPLANARSISIFGQGQTSAKAITDAANALNPGDIILIELHSPGPRHNFIGRNDQLGYIAVEWWPADFAAILYATSVRGIIVVEAAGNGAENLDDRLYDTRPVNFPASWTNPFNTANPQSGAILVGAGAPPPYTHGRNHGADRSRLDFSNWGARVDVQGIGLEVTTAGYGDLQGGSNEDLWYTDVFSGTSSSSPIVVGALACMQGGLKGANKTPLTPATAANILHTTGSPQQDEPGRPAIQHIGNRPDLKIAFQQLGLAPIKIKEQKEHKEIIKDKDIKDHKEHFKDQKDKEIIKENKELKDYLKEKDNDKDLKEKDTKDLKDIRERVKVVDVRPTALPAATDFETRLAELEGVVASLAHFIVPEERPDLQSSALAAEADLLALSQELQKQSIDAKTAKDTKDIEKLREG